mgnify:FL=1
MMQRVTKNDIYRAVAGVMPVLQVPCVCKLMSVIRPCGHCSDYGWIPSISLSHIITNIEYPFTLVFKYDMIGWYANITLDSEPTNLQRTNNNTYASPIEAIYEALFETLTDRIGEGMEVTRSRRTRGRGRPIRNKATEESESWKLNQLETE